MSRISCRVHTASVAQASCAWQLSNYSQDLAAARGREVVHVNLDETAVRLHPGKGKGAVFVSRARVAGRRGQRVAKWKQRCSMTHIGVLCDRPDLQKVLPQFILGNERALPARRLAALRAAAPSNVILVRLKSAWSSIAMTAYVIRRVAASIAAQRGRIGDVQLILILDAAKIHLHADVLRACKGIGAWLIVVPARMTFLLQPLDTHVFATYKWRFLLAYQRARAASAAETGDVDIADLLQCVYEAIRLVMEGRSWAHAFAQNGFCHQQAALCKTLKSQLELGQAVAVGATRPSDDQLRLCFPRRFNVRVDLYWSLFEARAPSSSGASSSGASAPAVSSGASSSSAAAVSVPGVGAVVAPVREPRTRAEHRAAAAAAAKVLAREPRTRAEHRASAAAKAKASGGGAPSR